MPRPKVEITLKCSGCSNKFTILQWEFKQKVNRNQNKFYCCRPCKEEHHKGNWKGGRRTFKSKPGYVVVTVSTRRREYEHRIVMEAHLGRRLAPNEVVHHINENPSDNRIENLMLCRNSGEHISKYHVQRGRDGKFISIDKMVDIKHGTN